MPYDVQVNDVDTALAVVEGADAPNGGLAFDTWHLGKLRLDPDELRRIPPRFVSWVELSDGPYEYAEDRLDEVINRRQLPGEGEFPILDYVAVLPRARLRRPLGRRGAVGGAPQPSDRRDVRPSLRDDERAARRVTRKEPQCLRRHCLRRALERTADLDVHADAADPRVRRARQADVRGAPGRDPRPHAPRGRRRGVDRRLARRAQRRRLRAHDLPLPRLPDRARHRHEGDDGRDLRPRRTGSARATAARCT